MKPLGPDRERVELRQCDVKTVTDPKADVVQAFNFSYYLLHPLAELISYFRHVLDSLAPGGLFLLDCYGGWDYQRRQKERRTVESPAGTFGFVWEHASFNPIDNRAECHIHFEFKNGKRWKRTFSYDFRLYSIAEIRDALDGSRLLPRGRLVGLRRRGRYVRLRFNFACRELPRLDRLHRRGCRTNSCQIPVAQDATRPNRLCWIPMVGTRH